MLKKRIDKDDNILYFYFDAWEHEGDPLRRIFLEELIEQFGQKNDYLKELQEEIANNKKTVKVKTKRTPTLFGTSLAILSFFVPIGIAIVSGTIDEIVLYNTHNPHWKFIIGSIFALIPFVPVLINFFYLFFKREKKVLDPRNWSFVLNTEDRDYEQEVYGDNERSSIEFENYFYKICHNIQSCDKKLVLVFDNLDRINQSDSLKLWSTLQTFLQNRNPSVQNIKHNKNIWAIIPYDSEGLKELWAKNEKCYSKEIKDANDYSNAQVISGYTKNDAVAKSFFDKSFQLRLHVPNMILDDWEQYGLELMEETLKCWEPEDRKRAIEVLKWTRNSLIDSPTPREIKTYINQIGILRYQYKDNYTIEAICCFVVEKYIFNKTNNEIEKDLISGTRPDARLINLLEDKELVDVISGILFGVSPEKGMQILLSDKINDSLENGYFETIRNIMSKHESTFWLITSNILSSEHEMRTMINYTYSIYNILNDRNRNKIRFFVNRIHMAIDKWETPDFPHINDKLWQNKLIALNQILIEFDLSIENYCKLMIGSFCIEVDHGNNPGYAVEYLSKFLMNLPKDSQFTVELEININGWTKIINFINNHDTGISKYLTMSEDILDKIASKIIPSNTINLSYCDLIRHAAKCNFTKWNNVQMAMKRYVEQGFGSSNSVNYYKLFEAMSEIEDDNIIETLIEIALNGRFWHYAYEMRQDPKVFMSIAIAWARLSQINKIANVSIVSNSRFGLSEAERWWYKKNKPRAKLVWDHVKNTNCSFLWNLSNNLENKLILDIIWLARDDHKHEFFNNGDVIQNYINAFNMISEDFEKTNIAFAFCENSDIEKNINSYGLDEAFIKANINAFESLGGATQNTELQEYLDPLVDKYSIGPE